MQLAGELSKMNLASLIRLVRNGELTGKVCLTQGATTAFLYFSEGQPIHVEADYGTGKDALFELFLWQSGTFSYIECQVDEVPVSIPQDEPLEKLLKEGLSYQDALRYLEHLRVNSRTVFKSTDELSDDLILSKMDGLTPLGDIVQSLSLARSEYVLRLQQLVASGKALVVEITPQRKSDIQLPDWVISRLKQDNADVSKAIVDLVIWADRIKCWLYQADVDLQRIIDGLSTPAGAETLEPSEESFVPQDLSSAAVLTELDQNPNQSQAAKPMPRPPGYEF